MMTQEEIATRSEKADNEVLLVQLLSLMKLSWILDFGIFGFRISAIMCAASVTGDVAEA
jgi:hypothetical protein